MYHIRDHIKWKGTSLLVSEAYIERQLLPPKQEKVFTHFCLRLDDWEYSLPISHVKELVNSMLPAKVP